MKRQSVHDDERLIDPNRLPAHVAFIMDGNRRWAAERGLPAIEGHRAGVKAFRHIVESCAELGIRYMTAYAFSIENWSRSPAEVAVLLHMFEYYTAHERTNLKKNGVRFKVRGDLEKLPVSLQKSFARTEKATEGQQKLLLNLCVNYGSRGEIVRAARELAGQVKAGQIEPEQIDEAAFESCLYTAGVPDPDLLIRTSGELRISNFLLWQVAYTEFFFSDLYWPDFNRRELVRAILDYQGRERRYGGGSPVPADVCG